MDTATFILCILLFLCGASLLILVIDLIQLFTNKEIFKWIGKLSMNVLGILLIIMIVIINYIIIVPVILLMNKSLKDLLFSEYEEDNHLGYLILKKRWGLLTHYILFMLCLNTPTIHWWWYSCVKEAHRLACRVEWFDKRYRYDDKDGKSVSKY